MNSRGNTFIELISVMVIISIAGLFAINGMNLVENIKFQTTIMQVEQAFNYAREHAVNTGKSYDVLYLNDKIYIKQGINSTKYTIDLSGNTYVAEDSTGKDILFRGTMAPTRAGTLELINDRIGKRAKITVRVATGKVTKYIYSY